MMYSVLLLIPAVMGAATPSGPLCHIYGYEIPMTACIPAAEYDARNDVAKIPDAYCPGGEGMKCCIPKKENVPKVAAWKTQSDQEFEILIQDVFHGHKENVVPTEDTEDK
ncbi:hypothetical protein CDD83_11067 [Cordyceps sp. RAO-2017]|nr:hypothetical protein CDD83_11067 [Cordyceps sp. RAO-2017]